MLTTLNYHLCLGFLQDSSQEQTMGSYINKAPGEEREAGGWCRLRRSGPVRYARASLEANITPEESLARGTFD
jgi:hypothetical protein